MTDLQMQSGRSQERGVALIMALFALLLLSAIAMGMMFMANTEMSVNNNYRDSQQAFYASQAGLTEARLRIMNDATAGTPMGAGMPNVTPTILPAAGNIAGATYITNPLGAEFVVPWNQTAGYVYRDDQFCKERYGITGGNANAGTAGLPCGVVGGNYPGVGWFKTTAASGLGSAGMTYFKWVRITRKQNLSSAPNKVDPASPDQSTICWNGKQEIINPVHPAMCETYVPAAGAINGYTTVFTAVSLAVGPTGARRMTESDIAIAPPVYANAAVDSQDHVTLNGQLTVNGYDNCSCMDMNVMTCNNQGKTPGSGTNLCNNPPIYGSRPGKSCDASKYAIFAASTVDNPGSSEQVIAGPNPPIASNQAWPYDIPSLIQSYQSNAKSVTAAPYNWSCTPPVTSGSPPVTVNGACGTHASQTFGTAPAFPPTPPDNPIGAVDQVTYIPGDAQLTSSASGSGVLIIDGDLDIHGGLQFYGLILVRGVVKSTGGGSDATNIYGAILAGKESLVDNVLGGSAVINFDACSLSRTKISNPPQIIAQREVMY
jgi:Tfp pilus assembly protein PilX